MNSPVSSSGEELPSAPGSTPKGVTYREALRVWTKIGLNSFGGPAGQIAVMHRVLVEEKRWISETRFLHALNYCMLLPGPEAMQLATYVGWLMHRTLGGLTAGILFVLPGFISILTLSILYAGFQDVGVVAGLFFGLKPAVLAVVVEAVIRIGRKALKNNVMVSIAAAAFVAIFFFDVPFPLIVLSAGLIGFFGGIVRREKFLIIKGHGASTSQSTASAANSILGEDVLKHTRPTLGRSFRVLVLWSFLWLGPIVLMAVSIGSEHLFVQQATFFSKAAMVTFGGAYSVLAYVAQMAVETFGWLQPGEMLDGLGMAETTPGPLIQVVQFVGFMGAFRHATGLHPMLAGLIASVIVTWVTYVPCFLWIFLGAPYIEILRGRESLSCALSAITAAVVGVVLNLAVWFSLHTLFGSVDEVTRWALRLYVPRWSSLQVPSLVLALLAVAAIIRFKMGMLPTLAGCAVLGAAYYVMWGG